MVTKEDIEKIKSTIPEKVKIIIEWDRDTGKSRLKASDGVPPLLILWLLEGSMRHMELVTKVRSIKEKVSYIE
jgi:hypothetical protein